MPEVHIIKVFVDKHGQFGDLTSTVFDTRQKLNTETRQKLTRQIGHAETVFVNDLEDPQVSIFNPQQEVQFAGAPILGAAWLLSKRLEKSSGTIHCLGGDIRTWHDGQITWIQADLGMMPTWQFKQLAAPEDVTEFSAEVTQKLEHTVVWAWLDESAGLIRARTFASDWEIPEAEANGSGSMLLAASLSRKLEIHHGRGSIIYAEPAGDDSANVGGRAVMAKPQVF